MGSVKMKGVADMTTTYNGWKNWETWAAGLWIDNEEPNYRIKLQYFKACRASNTLPTFTGFLRYAMRRMYLVNTDVSWSNSRISRRELTEDLRVEFDEWRECNG